MTDFHAVTADRHGNLACRKIENFLFAASDALCPLGSAEIPQAALAAPIAFVESETGFLPAFIQGLEPGHNLFVNDRGLWSNRYVPRKYRNYPYALLKNQEGDLVLCIDESSDFLCEPDTKDSYALFDSDGNPSETVKIILNEIQQTNSLIESAERIANELQQHSLIKPWELSITSNGQSIEVNGLHCIDENQLNRLDSQALESLRNSRALLVAYSQILSMPHAQRLSKLTKQHADSKQFAEIMLDAPDSGSINFDNL
jgi:hypothetical protein